VSVTLNVLPECLHFCRICGPQVLRSAQVHALLVQVPSKHPHSSQNGTAAEVALASSSPLTRGRAWTMLPRFLCDRYSSRGRDKEGTLPAGESAQSEAAGRGVQSDARAATSAPSALPAQPGTSDRRQQSPEQQEASSSSVQRIWRPEGPLASLRRTRMTSGSPLLSLLWLRDQRFPGGTPPPGSVGRLLRWEDSWHRAQRCCC